MEHTVPQFIEREPPIVGPMTFKQFIFIGVAGAFCIFIYFFIPLTYFIIIAVIVMGFAIALAFVKIQKIPLPTYLKNFFLFLFKPKIYLWKKETTPTVIYKKESELKTQNIEENKGYLNKLFTFVQTKK
ncbi:MAG TPA: PrgI family protein [Candidatus Pacearchaeota archaeon]|nr:PrgI family protein [Candidatus Pacearchaeota archaeon]